MLDGCDFDWLVCLLALDSLGTPLGDSTRVDLSVAEVVSCSRQEVESVARATLEFHAAERMDGWKRRRWKAGSISTGYSVRSDLHRWGPLSRTRVWRTHSILRHALNRKQSRLTPPQELPRKFCGVGRLVTNCREEL